MRTEEQVLKEEKAKELAEAHWDWVETWLHMIFVDAFVHGYKHGSVKSREGGVLR